MGWLRRRWRRFKSEALSGHRTAFGARAYRLLAPVVTRLKRVFPAVDLADRALWLMYHPEVGVLPCDGWMAADIPVLDQSEMRELKTRWFAERKSVEDRLHVEDVVLSSESPTDVLPAGRTAVHLHVYFPELLPRIVLALKNIPVGFDLYVSIPVGVSWNDTEERTLREELPMAGAIRCERCPNRGRDIAPLICLFGGELARYDYVAHVHTKKSSHEYERRSWLEFVLASLFPDEKTCIGILSLLGRRYGMVVAPDYLPMPEDPTGWMHNRHSAEALLERVGLTCDLGKDYTPCVFPQGSMFWARGDFLARFFALPLRFEDFPQEPIAPDATLAHALERLFFFWGLDTGLHVARLRMGACDDD